MSFIGSPPCNGVVLAGGGARGAYEAGVLSGLFEVLDKRGPSLSFRVLCGSSIGALNATWLAAHAHEPDHGVAALLREWRGLELGDTIGSSALTMLLSPSHRAPGESKPQWSLLRAKALESLVHDRIPWARLHENTALGLIDALLVPALHIATGTTTTFAQLAPRASFRPSHDLRRNARMAVIGPEHVLASCAFPWLYPAREVEGQWYCDGGIRYNTPISPALRAGADRLLVISLLAHRDVRHLHREQERVHALPNPLFLLGKIVNAFLLDPVEYDLSVLERVNRIMEVFDQAFSPQERERFDQVIARTRGIPYRSVPTLVFQPSRDLAQMASDFLAERKSAAGVAGRLLSAVHRYGRAVEADFMSFILLDGGFASRLIELGRRDVFARADEVVRFYSAPALT